MMKKAAPAASPDAYVGALRGWRRKCVESLRSAVMASGSLEEVVKWGHLVYVSNGPAMLIRAEEERVLFGLWRGQRLLEIEPRLKCSGKYEMATLELREGDEIKPSIVSKLAKQATALNKKLGNPQDEAKSKPNKATKKTAKRTARKSTKKATKIAAKKTTKKAKPKSKR